MKINKTYIFLLLVCLVMAATTIIGLTQKSSQLHNDNESTGVQIQVSSEIVPTSTPDDRI
jgi:cell division protein FtsL